MGTATADEQRSSQVAPWVATHRARLYGRGV
jgi:hypothetical protein